jgi:hypothetical protein
MIIWNPDDLPVDGTGRYYVPSLMYVVDGYGYVTSKSMSIFFETPVSNTTTTTSSTTLDWETLLPIVGSVSIVGVIGIVLGIRRMRK